MKKMSVKALSAATLMALAAVPVAPFVAQAEEVAAPADGFYIVNGEHMQLQISLI